MQPKKKFTVLIERDADGYYLATAPALRGCHTQAKTPNALMKRVREVIKLCLEVENCCARTVNLVGVYQVSV